jgi:hypothetical protein
VWLKPVELSTTPIATRFLQPVSISLNIPSLLSDLWDSVLRAVPFNTVRAEKMGTLDLATARAFIKTLHVFEGLAGHARFLPITPIATRFLQPVSISLNIPSLLSDLWDSVGREDGHA